MYHLSILPEAIPDIIRFRKGVFFNLRVAIFLFAFCGALSVALLPSAANAPVDQDIRIDVPAGRVRVENQFGPIVASVWNEKYVSVSATIEGSIASFKRSPIVIDNRDKFLTISVVRRPLDPAVSIGLVVKLPAGVHAEINTGSGAINISGIPASASLRSASGDIRAELQSPLNADINARSVAGVISSTLDAPLSGAGHVLQTRLGTGENVLRINSDSGTIHLELAERRTESSTETESPRMPNAGTAAGGAGTPASGAETEEVSEGDIIRVDSQLTTVNVSVVDRNTNRGVTGLTPSGVQPARRRRPTGDSAIRIFPRAIRPDPPNRPLRLNPR